MFMLAIDTSGADCAAGIFDGDSHQMLASVSQTIGKGHAEKLMDMIDEALAGAGRTIGEIAMIAVTVGPGSFTGIRVGVAAARGFALALGCPAVGVSTLEIIAQPALNGSPGRVVMAVMDAKRGEIYVQLFAPDRRPLGDSIALLPEDALALARQHDAVIVGSGRRPILEDLDVGPDKFPLAVICRIAGENRTRPEKPTPLYIRGADAKPQAGFAILRS